MKRLLYVICIILFSAFFISNVHTAFAIDDSSLILKLSPEFPQSNQPITLTIQSAAVDLDRSSVSWYVNGALELQGIAKKSHTVVAGPNGSQKTVRVVVIAPNNIVLEQTATIAPSELGLIWQTNTSVPPFYKGKALFSNGSDITFIALPSSATYRSRDLVFTWRKDGQAIENSGGLGGDSVRISGDSFAKPILIAVEAYSSDGKYRGFNSTTITPRFPLIKIYENHPTQGIKFEHAFSDNDTLTSTETVLEVFPYFFSTANRNLKDMNLTWSVNNEPVLAAANKNSIIVRKQEGAVSASIGVDIKNIKNVLQFAQTNIQLKLSK